MVIEEQGYTGIIAAHMDMTNTNQELAQHFYCLEMEEQLKEFGQRCEESQRQGDCSDKTNAEVCPL